MDTGEKVRRWRKEKGWNQAELARRAGISQETVSSVERGRTVLASASTLQTLARALGKSIQEMLEPDEDRLAGLVEEISRELEALGRREPEHAERALALKEELQQTLLGRTQGKARRPGKNPSPPARRRSGRT